MVEEALQVVRLHDDFYRDGFRKIIYVLGIILSAIVLLVCASLYLFLSKPAPIMFSTHEEWRILAPVPLTVPYLRTPELLQWVGNVWPSVFTYDFINYDRELQNNKQYFTQNGWKAYINLLNNYAGFNALNTSKIFSRGRAVSAPSVVNEGVIPEEQRYGWWVQMPVNVDYFGTGNSSRPVELQILVVRIPIENNLFGVAIENMALPTKGEGQ